MSYSSLYVVLFVNLGFISVALEWPKWVYALSLIVGSVFGAFAVNQFDNMRERVAKLEKELKERKDGADNE